MLRTTREEAHLALGSMGRQSLYRGGPDLQIQFDPRAGFSESKAVRILVDGCFNV